MEKDMRCYEFMDMCSGGYQKTKYTFIFIVAESQDKAVNVFKKTFKRNPFNITCDCCGFDFEIQEYKDLEEASFYNLKVDSFFSFSNENVLVIGNN